MAEPHVLPIPSPPADNVDGPAFVEIVPERTYALGGALPLDRRLSWAPSRPGRFQTVNCYLLKEGSQALLVDTGVRMFWPSIERGLRELLEPGSRLKVFITRPELDSVGNLPLLRELYEIDDTDVMAGGTDTPFDFFDTAVSRRSPEADRSPEALVAAHSVLRTDGFDVTPGRPVRVIVPKLRFLPTFWPFDLATRTLFTSDLFSHVDQPDAGPVRVVTGATSARPSAAVVASHLLCKFWWLPGATTEEFRDDLRSIFDGLSPEIVAPAYGAVLQGAEVIRMHLECLLDVLDDCRQRGAGLSDRRFKLGGDR